jgi:hypothetical protein
MLTTRPWREISNFVTGRNSAGHPALLHETTKDGYSGESTHLEEDINLALH